MTLLMSNRDAGAARRLWLGALVMLVLASSAPARTLIVGHEFRVMSGDNNHWMEPSLDDTDWPRLQLTDVPESDGIVILRTRLNLDSINTVEDHPLGLYFAALAACEVAWDGVVIGRSGEPAAEASREIPGPIENHWVIPDRLAAPGEHVVALRCSAHQRHFHASVGYWALLAGDYDRLLSATRSQSWVALSSLSGLLMVGMFAMFMYVGDRRDRSFLWLGALGLCAGALLLAESWRSLFGYTYNWHLLRLIVITALTALLNLALVGFVSVRYPGTRSRQLRIGLIALLGLSLLVPSWDGKALAMFIAGLVLATGWMLRAMRQRQRGSLPAFIGLSIALGALVWQPLNFADLVLYVALDLLFACLLVSHVIQTRHLRLTHEQALLKSARLESELLRKHIQPHFLMNTLTALSEWIEQEPKVAVELIDSISEEFRILGRIADQTLIELGVELELCRTHIAIMNRRRDRKYTLAVDGVDVADQVPPAIFHTLVENAITHDASASGPTVLRISARVEGHRVRYVFEAPCHDYLVPVAEGTGLRYIRARMQESFADDWSLHAAAVGNVWRSEIVMPRRQ
jgi:hypothetical protein